MRSRRKRKPDFRRIGPSRTYSIAELAEAVDRTRTTVRTWIREGMPTIDDFRPVVIDGGQAKAWLREKWGRRKTPTGADEAHCMRCRQPRPFAHGTRHIKNNKGKTLMIAGKCAVCGCQINKFASAKSVTILDSGNERKRDNNAA